MKVTANFDKKLLNITGVIGNIKQDINESLRDSAKLIEKNIKAELRSPDKRGVIKPKNRRRASPTRRSAPGQSLARDTGASERLISSQKTGNTKMEVGFRTNEKGFDYVEYQEVENNRPTMQLAVEKSLGAIESIFETKLTPKK